MSKTYVIDVGIRDEELDTLNGIIGFDPETGPDTDDALKFMANLRQAGSDIFSYAEELGFYSPSSGGGLGFRDAQFETTDEGLAKHYIAWAESRLPDEESYVSVYIERRGWFWDKVLLPIWKLAFWLDIKGHHNMLDKLTDWQHRD
jgi:hypothetical protein